MFLVEASAEGHVFHCDSIEEEKEEEKPDNWNEVVDY